MNKTRITRLKTLTVIAIAAVWVSVSALAQQGCYQNPTNTTCAPPNIAPDAYTNGCVGEYYDPSHSTYCDVRDGQPGMTNCTPTTVYIVVYQARKAVTQDPNDTSKLICSGTPVITGPFLAGGTCAIASLSGDPCGYSPH